MTAVGVDELKEVGWTYNFVCFSNVNVLKR